mmetsp:Transcript_25501/g.64277  ORF Transcript_25501/g.64277 Transcript_25501/m.64277 type:complete len:224 (-) Transcript_25501:1690-2361(-)
MMRSSFVYSFIGMWKKSLAFLNRPGCSSSAPRLPSSGPPCTPSAMFFTTCTAPELTEFGFCADSDVMEILLVMLCSCSRRTLSDMTPYRNGGAFAAEYNGLFSFISNGFNPSRLFLVFFSTSGPLEKVLYSSFRCSASCACSHETSFFSFVTSSESEPSHLGNRMPSKKAEPVCSWICGSFTFGEGANVPCASPPIWSAIHARATRKMQASTKSSRPRFLPGG